MISKVVSFLSCAREFGNFPVNELFERVNDMRLVNPLTLGIGDLNLLVKSRSRNIEKIIHVKRLNLNWEAKIYSLNRGPRYIEVR